MISASKILLLFLAAVFMPLAVVSFAANQSEFKSTIEEVELAGRLSSESFVKPDGKKGREVILTLRDPVSIDGDEFSGPKTGVIKVQLVFSNNRIRGKTTRLLNRNVRIIGILFHAHKPEHRAPVLMDVKKVAAARA